MYRRSVTACRGSLGAILSNFDSLLLKKLAASFASMTHVGIADRGERTQTANKVWLTPHQVEQMYGISCGLLWRLRGSGDVQSATIGSRGLSVSRASLDAYMVRRARDASDE